jgi:hypothetical protein
VTAVRPLLSTRSTASTPSTFALSLARPVARSLVPPLYRLRLANTNCVVTFVMVTRTTSTSDAVQASWIR